MRYSERMLIMVAVLAVAVIAIGAYVVADSGNEVDGDAVGSLTLHYPKSDGSTGTKTLDIYNGTKGPYVAVSEPRLNYSGNHPILNFNTKADGSGTKCYANEGSVYIGTIVSDLYVITDTDSEWVNKFSDGATYTYVKGDTIPLSHSVGNSSSFSGEPEWLNTCSGLYGYATLCGKAEEAGTWDITFTYVVGGWVSEITPEGTYGATGPGSITFTIVVTDNPTVSFSSNGSIIATQTLDPNGTATYVEPPAREGYTFAGWFSDAGCTSQYDFSTPVTSDITLYAKWIENPVTITFMVEGKVYSTLAVPKGSVGVVYTPVMVTGVFAGWYYDEDFTDKYDATRALDKDITLYAYGVPPLIFTSEPNASANIQQVSSYGMFFFDATDSSGRYQIEWDFGDGNTSTDAIAYNTYAAPGVYTVTLKVTNIYGESSTTTYDVVYRDPAAEGGGQ